MAGGDRFIEAGKQEVGVQKGAVVGRRGNEGAATDRRACRRRRAQQVFVSVVLAGQQREAGKGVRVCLGAVLSDRGSGAGGEAAAVVGVVVVGRV